MRTPLADVQVDPLGLLFRVGDPHVGQGVGVEAVLRQARVAHAARRHAPRAQHRDISVAQAAGLDAAVQDLAHLGAAVRDRHAQLGEAVEEAVEVVFDAKEGAAPGAHHVVGHVGAREAPVEHRDLRFRERLPVAVDEDRAAFEFACLHRSHRRPSWQLALHACRWRRTGVDWSLDRCARRAPGPRVAPVHPKGKRCSKLWAFANRTAAAPSSATCRSRSVPARSSACSGRTAPASRRPWRCSAAWSAPTAARCSWARARRARSSPSAAQAPKRRIGVVPQELSIYENLGAAANLELFGALYGLGGALLKERVDAAMKLVGLADRARDKPSTFSGGMKRRLNIAAALVHDPDILILDEPTVGVDPQSRNAIFDNLEELRRRGKALLYTTHYMEEAERLCDRIVIVDHGKVVASDTLAGIEKLLPATLPARDRGRRRRRSRGARHAARRRAPGAGRAGAARRRRRPRPRHAGAARRAGGAGPARHAHRLGAGRARRRLPIVDRPRAEGLSDMNASNTLTALKALVRKDLVLYFSNRRALVMSIAAPIVIAAFFGSLFGSGGGKNARIPVALTDLDGSTISKQIDAGFACRRRARGARARRRAGRLGRAHRRRPRRDRVAEELRRGRATRHVRRRGQAGDRAALRPVAERGAGDGARPALAARDGRRQPGRLQRQRRGRRRRMAARPAPRHRRLGRPAGGTAPRPARDVRQHRQGAAANGGALGGAGAASGAGAAASVAAAASGAASRAVPSRCRSKPLPAKPWPAAPSGRTTAMPIRSPAWACSSSCSWASRSASACCWRAGSACGSGCARRRCRAPCCSAATS